MSKGRVEAFSDGVFAVAATLLIFNVQIDKTATGGLLAALLAAWPKYAAYVASFLTIGVMWMNHHGLFGRIARLDRILVFLNLLLLMAIVFIAFSTAELGANILVPRDANTAASVYAINASVIAILFGAVWLYALAHPDLLSPDVDREAARRAWPRFSVGSVVYLACIPLGLISPIAV
ncbi:MAG TPA: TMEM175 family protein, partial [Candidatus Dormibacteraeota bacterium]|nr:TMEM175 family protein [Candidatus Dormibacteraeota bacterium]